MKYFPHILALTFIVLFVVLGINPADRTVWIAEVIPVVIIFFAYVFTFNKFRFTNLAYFLMSIWLFWHTIGAHYMFSHVPFDFVTDLFGFERNNFDRFSHFFVGFCAYGVSEFMLRKKYTSKVVSMLFGLCFIMSIACGYEIIEWLTVTEDDTTNEFLGMQGDIWDAQKDMLLDTLGAMVALVIFYFNSKNQMSTKY